MSQISVVVPVYNVQEKFNRCVDSIRVQSFIDFECILVDDGSPDKSSEICDECALTDSRFFSVHQPNKGVSTARNIGIDMSFGKYLSFIDSDDYVDKEYLLALYNSMFSCELVICGVTYMSDSGIVITQQENRGNYQIKLTSQQTVRLAELLDDRKLNYVYSKLYLSEIIRSNHIRFEEDICLGEDTFFVMEYFNYIKTISIVGDSFYFYVKYCTNTLSSLFKISKYDEMMLINNKIMSVLKRSELWDNNTIRSYEKRVMNAARWSIDELINTCEVSIFEKKILLKHISEDSVLQSVLKNNNQFVDEYSNFEYIKNGKTVCIIYKNKILNLINGFKRIIVKIFPRSFIIGVKKCLKIYR